MAALPYMQFYIADYYADTSHLSTLEHGVYLMLIHAYFQKGESFKAKDQQTLNRRLANVVKMTESEWENVKDTISEFFETTETEWKHHRIERELEAVRHKSEMARAAGKASARKRESFKPVEIIEDFNECSTDAQRTFNGRSTIQITDNRIKENNTHGNSETCDAEMSVVDEFKNTQSEEIQASEPIKQTNQTAKPTWLVDISDRLNKPKTPEQPTQAGAMAKVLREKGVDCTSQNPVLLAWIKDGFTLDYALECVEIARNNKPLPMRIPANYLDAIIRAKHNQAPPPKPQAPRREWQQAKPPEPPAYSGMAVRV